MTPRDEWPGRAVFGVAAVASRLPLAGAAGEGKRTAFGRRQWLTCRRAASLRAVSHSLTLSLYLSLSLSLALIHSYRRHRRRRRRRRPARCARHTRNNPARRAVQYTQRNGRGQAATLRTFRSRARYGTRTSRPITPYEIRAVRPSGCRKRTTRSSDTRGGRRDDGREELNRKSKLYGTAGDRNSPDTNGRGVSSVRTFETRRFT